VKGIEQMKLNLIILTTILLGGFSSLAAQPSADPCADTKTRLTQAENRLKEGLAAVGPLS